MSMSKHHSLLYRCALAALVGLSLTTAAQEASAQCAGIEIPDDDPAGISDTFEVSDTGTVTDVNLVISDLPHTCLGDLELTLRSPDGTSVIVVADSVFAEDGIFDDHLPGICPDNFLDTVMDDDSATNLADGAAPFTGSFNVDHAASVGTAPLSTFDGESANGTWTLFVADMAAADVGCLDDWSVEVTTAGGGDTGTPDIGLPDLGGPDLGLPDLPSDLGGGCVIAIPDNNETGISDTTFISAAGTVSDVNVIISELPHTCLSDLQISLQAPSGTTHELIHHGIGSDGVLDDHATFCPDNFIGTRLDDEAATNLAAGVSPGFTGSFNIDHALSVGSSPLANFDGESATGTWTLFVADRAGADTGCLNSWSLEVSTSGGGGDAGTDVGDVGGDIFSGSDLFGGDVLTPDADAATDADADTGTGDLFGGPDTDTGTGDLFGGTDSDVSTPDAIVPDVAVDADADADADTDADAVAADADADAITPDAITPDLPTPDVVEPDLGGDADLGPPDATPDVVTPDLTSPGCGDGLIVRGETCDDGNTLSGDGCSSDCTVEDDYECLGEPSVCTESSSSDLTPGEEGDVVGGGGCACSATGATGLDVSMLFAVFGVLATTRRRRGARRGWRRL